MPVPILALLLWPCCGAVAAEPGNALHLDGAALGIRWVLPFVGILLSIALFPLLAPRLWHHHFGKISAAWAAAFLLPFAARFGLELTAIETLHTALLEYVPFIILLFALFTVTGGLRLRTSGQGTPAFNTGILAVGTGLASWMGTTGAAMLLIRPLLRANAARRFKVHVVVFFIFLVANIGGSLTPLGDPPLFLGFLKGVDFFWPTRMLFGPMILVSSILLVIFYVLDHMFWRREQAAAPTLSDEPRFRMEGNINLVCIGDYAHPKARFPGSFGSAYLYYVVPKVILFRLEHTRRTLVPKVDFISAPGGSAGNVHRPGGPVALITNRCLFSFDQDRRRFVLESVHPGHTLAEIIVNTGFEFDRPPDVPVTPAPSAETLRLLREVVAPELAEVYPQFAARVFGTPALSPSS